MHRVGGFQAVAESSIPVAPLPGSDLAFTDELVTVSFKPTKKKKKEKPLPKAPALSSLFGSSAKQPEKKAEAAPAPAMASPREPTVLESPSHELYDPFHPAPPARVSRWQQGFSDLPGAAGPASPSEHNEEEDVDELELYDQAVAEQAQKDIKQAVKKGKLKAGKDIAAHKLYRPSGKQGRSAYGANVGMS